jgi:peptidoglycan hydrolase CwlO-like protein
MIDAAKNQPDQPEQGEEIKGPELRSCNWPDSVTASSAPATNPTMDHLRKQLADKDAEIETLKGVISGNADLINERFEEIKEKDAEIERFKKRLEIFEDAASDYQQFAEPFYQIEDCLFGEGGADSREHVVQAVKDLKANVGDGDHVNKDEYIKFLTDSILRMQQELEDTRDWLDKWYQSSEAYKKQLEKERGAE